MPRDFKLEEFLPFRLNMLALEVSGRLSEIYSARFGLDIPQWRILANLASRGQATAQDIVRVTLNHKSTISRAVQELEIRGLIGRAVSDADKRAYALRLTAEGKRLFRQLLPLVLAFERNLMRSIPNGDASALLRGIGALEQALRITRRERPRNATVVSDRPRPDATLGRE
jgi:DNA-binding MarR family transcriptional regulator